jgi:aspartyl/glutamyl-tRNA(Asn/Gln) amidotransferase C subunit
MAHPTDLTNKLREDNPTGPLPNEAVLANAPQSDPPYFRVPKVLGDGPSA